jgi:hypothetical protein
MRRRCAIAVGRLQERPRPLRRFLVEDAGVALIQVPFAYWKKSSPGLIDVSMPATSMPNAAAPARPTRASTAATVGKTAGKRRGKRPRRIVRMPPIVAAPPSDDPKT